ncbi:hypothetical protein OOK31_32055 [Streptomyces sp. NBC_00249]|uniref:hypothetical protein n=1 Tax=Streptomyces sp. NBC_00249 TaxID=2975690 RepID=UPI00224E0B72|nr:hypothetical protein [Streptomyces sp. NBC_00249]MCX5198465.1 hypothetical protein [Streptomyces sp. NBC_00249]
MAPRNAKLIPLALAAAATLAAAPPAPAPAPAPRLTSAAQLAQAYRATAKFHRHEAGVAAGYVPDKYCVVNPSGGAGALGYPHFNHAYDGSVDPKKPTALLYEGDGAGRWRLAGLEWMVVDRDGREDTDDDRPSLFGEPFRGPLPARYPGQKVHYSLHLWLWKGNPAGRFEPFNPSVVCRPGTTRPPRPAAAPATTP